MAKGIGHNRADLFRLQFKYAEAFPHLERAYQYRPDNLLYAAAYAMSLMRDKKNFTKAIEVYIPLVKQLRTKPLNALLDPRKVEKVGPRSREALVYLANAYRSVGRLREAEATYKEAIGAYRELAAYGPDAYESPRYSPSADESIAMTLENLADLYRAMQRPTEADATCAEFRALVSKSVGRVGVSPVCKQK